MDIGLGMNSHGILTRDETDCLMQSISVELMEPLGFAAEAERLGYDSVWIPDHVFVKADSEADTAHPANHTGKRAYPTRPVMLDNRTLMAMVLASTKTLGVASSVLVAPYRHPLAVAHEFATFDAVSGGGRVRMGVGAGWSQAEFESLGVSFEDRNEITDEAIEIFRLAWAEPVLEFHGKHFDFADLSLDPKPASDPLPIYVAGTFPVAARRAARLGDGFYPMFLDPLALPSRFVGLVEAIAREADRVGRDLRGFRLLGMCSALVVDPDDPAARAQPRAILTGTAEQILEQIQDFADHGYSHLTLHFDVRDGGVEALHEQVRRFAEEVLPQARHIKATAKF